MKVKLPAVRAHLRLLVGSALLVVALAGAGLLGLFAVRLIPDSRILRHTGQSAEILVREGDWPDSLCSRLDNFTDSLILNIASYDGREGVLECALMNYFRVTDAAEGVEALAARFARRPVAGSEWIRAQYVRYWFGGVALVRPALYLMNYSQWRTLNTVLVFVSLAVLLYLTHVARLMRYGIAFLVPFLLMDPMAIGKSLQFSPCFYLSMLPAILLLAMRKTRLAGSPACRALFFAGIGALTAYFDLLTYPILTFALPMAFILLVNRGDDTATKVKTVVACLAHWALGFLLMWLLKWVLATALTDVNAFYEAFQKVAERSGSQADDGFRISRLHAVRVNFLAFLPHLNAWMVGGFLLALLSLYRGGMALLWKWAPAFLVAALPPAWMFLTANHAYIHHFFVSKGLTASVFVFLCWAADAMRTKRGGKRP